jgi:sterol desaturase/sphingolipid hydroxylase (fatty acid hydroxylase superfamily)
MELFHGPGAVRAFMPVLLVAIIVEGLLYWRRNHRYRWRDSIASLAIAVGHNLSGIVSQIVISTGLAVVVWRYRVATIDLEQWTNLVALFVLVEFVYYWYHRAAHSVRLFWG